MACCDCCIGVPPIRPPISVSEQSDALRVSDINAETFEDAIKEITFIKEFKITRRVINNP